MKKSKTFHSISVSLSLKFTFILVIAIFFLSVAILATVALSIHNQRDQELKQAYADITVSLSEDEIEDLHRGFPFIAYYITYLVYSTKKDAILATNDPFLPILPETKKHVKLYKEKNYFIDGDLNILYYTKKFISPKDTYIVQTSLNLDLDSYARFAGIIPKVIGITFLPIAFLSFLSLLGITKMTLTPVKKVTETARHIGSTNLDILLPTSKKGNELDELAETFNELFTRLKKDFDRERQFTSDVSHELKTPVTVIMGQANLLRRWGKDDPVQLEKSINAIHEESKSMSAIITNLLQMGRLESGRTQVKIEQVKLIKLFQRIKDETQSVNPDAVVNFDENINLEIPADAELLHQVFMVIISNSLKFVESPVKINIKCQKTEEGTEICFEDNGNGFPEESLEHVFERFYRADSSHTRTAGGSGLGLSIAKTIINSMNGNISAYNAKPVGAGIRILLK